MTNRLQMTRESASSLHGLEASKNLLSADDRTFFASLNGANYCCVLQAFAQGVPQQVLTFLQNLDDRGFKESFQPAFFNCCHFQYAKEKTSISQKKKQGNGVTAQTLSSLS